MRRWYYEGMKYAVFSDRYPIKDAPLFESQVDGEKWATTRGYAKFVVIPAVNRFKCIVFTSPDRKSVLESPLFDVPILARDWALNRNATEYRIICDDGSDYIPEYWVLQQRLAAHQKLMRTESPSTSKMTPDEALSTGEGPSDLELAAGSSNKRILAAVAITTLGAGLYGLHRYNKTLRGLLSRIYS
jgi:hypothetical protein